MPYFAVNRARALYACGFGAAFNTPMTTLEILKMGDPRLLRIPPPVTPVYGLELWA